MAFAAAATLQALALLGSSLLLTALPATAGAGHDQPAPAAKTAPSTTERIRSAESAAPLSLSRASTAVVIEAQGRSAVLPQGSNNISRMPDSSAPPGPDPLCGDANAMEWDG